MKEKILFVCIGQFGGNIGQLFEQLNYNCLFINTSYNDLLTIEAKHKYHIPGGKGCSKDKQKAFQYAKDYYQTICSIISDKFPLQNIVYFVFSLGGGTGSGISPIILDILSNSNLNKTYGIITTLPNLNESIQAQINTVETYKQLSKIQNIKNYFILDNGNYDKFELNNVFVSRFDRLIKISIPNQKGIIDESEIETILSTKGSIIISEFTNQYNSDKVDIFTQHNIGCKYQLVSVNKSVDFYNIDNIFGTPYDKFIGYNDLSNFITISGMNLPTKQIGKIIENIERNQEKIIKNTNILENFDFKIPQIKQYQSINNSNSNNKISIENFEDIFKKYE